MFKNIFVGAIVFVLLLFHSWQAVANQKMIEDISFDAPSAKEERILFKLNGTYIPKIFTLQGKQPRVVFDFDDIITAKTVNNIINTNGKLIKRVRVGIHEGSDPKTRIVLDLMPNKNVDIRQDFERKKKVLVVSVHYTGPAPEKKVVTVKPALQKSKKKPQKTKPAKVTATTAPSPVKKEKKKPVIATKKQQAPAARDKASDGLLLLTSITFENDSNRGEMVLFKLNEFHPPVVFGIEEGTPRVVCDFKNTAAAKNIPDSMSTKGKFIQKVRIGRETAEKKVRVVLDLTPNYSYDLQQVFFKDDNIFVIIINTLAKASVAAPEDLHK